MVERQQDRSVPVLFCLTLFLSAGLMFSFQPMIGKMLLPIVGGAPSGWLVALAFFQLSLLAGYLAAHLASKLSPRRQAYAYLVLLGIGGIFLPVHLNRFAGFLGDTTGAGDVFLLLTLTAAVPFIALSATSSTLQRLFSGIDHPASANPYFLYVASNLGSFAGLFLYPLVIEPSLRLSEQSNFWFFGYLLLIAAVGFCLLPGRGQPEKPQAAAQTEDNIPLRLRLYWVLLAFAPSSLMMGVTAYAASEINSIPLLWVIPLGLYLLTFVISFSNRQLVSMDWLTRAQPVAVMLAIVPMFIIPAQALNRLEVFALHAIVFTVVALLCHGLLAKSRPATAKNLTLFYLLLATGGALGGVLNAFAAPLIFKGATEYPIVLIASCVLNPAFRFRRWDFLFILPAALLVAVKMVAPPLFAVLLTVFGFFTVPLLFLTLIAVHPRATLITSALIAFAAMSGVSADSVYEGRSFYGIVKVYHIDEMVDGKAEKIRYFSHGTTVHGKQSMEPGKETQPTAYFTKDGPLGDIFATFKPHNVAVVGLGVGTIACYGTKDTDITYFEIDPLVQMVAEKYFTFLSRCGTGKPPGIVLGDGRLSLARSKDDKYDLIILDAFSSDAVPTHLLTKEAMQLYFDRLRAGGIVLFHITNRHFFLAPPLAAEAQALGYASRYIEYGPPNNAYADPSQWIVIADREAAFDRLTKLPWQRPPEQLKTAVWTDDFDDLLSVMRF